MRKLWLLPVLILLLSGCAAPESFETMADIYEEPELPEAQPVSILLEEAAVAVSDEEDWLYLCDDYCVMVQTFAGGDLEGTLREVTGFSRDKLTLMEYRRGDLSCYECVWVSAGEGSDQVGKLRLLDDGNHHYVLSVMAPASQAPELTDTWEKLFESFRLGELDTTKG